jgi:outer membrane protein OmpA-like peptidoglycan-associated protein
LFESGSAEITHGGRQVIDDFLSYARLTKPLTNILVSCHTDRVGSEAYNLALSTRRCRAVRDALIETGIPQDLLVVRPRGEGEPEVPTRDGVSEVANRSVVIDFCVNAIYRRMSCK